MITLTSSVLRHLPLFVMNVDESSDDVQSDSTYGFQIYFVNDDPDLALASFNGFVLGTFGCVVKPGPRTFVDIAG